MKQEVSGGEGVVVEERLDCLLWVERGGRWVGVGAGAEIGVSGFRISKEFDWERKGVEVET